MSADARRRRFKELVADRRSPCPVLVPGDLPKSSIAEMAEAGGDVIVYYSSLSAQPPMASVARSPVSRRPATFDCSARSWRAATPWTPDWGTTTTPSALRYTPQG